MSQATYSVYLADAFGVRLAVLNGWESIQYGRVVNGVSGLSVTLPASQLDWRWIARDQRLEVWRSVDGVESLDTETVWVVRGRKKWRTKQGQTMIQLQAVSANHLLTRRIVAYSASSVQASKSGAADNLMKAFVRENLGTLATNANRRWNSLLEVAVDVGAGPSLEKACAWRNLHTVLQELALASVTAGTPTFFDVVAPAVGQLEFRTYVGLRGNDHSTTGLSSVVVAPERDNLGDASLDEDWDEATCAYAGGQGQGALRLVVEVQDATRVGSSPFGRIETFTSATNQALSSAALQQEGYAALRDKRPKRVFAGDILDTPGTRYGREWGWGDRVVAAYDDEVFVCRVDAVQVSVSAGKETIRARLRMED